MKRDKTYMANPADVETAWRLVDAAGQTLGRLAVQVSRTLQGKDKAIYTPHVITGDHVVVVNASKLKVTGHKLTQKIYYHHTQYLGHMKTPMLRDLMEDHPDRVLRLAVKGMLPRSKLGRDMLKRLKIYRGDSHPHEAQLAAPRPAPSETGEGPGER